MAIKKIKAEWSEIDKIFIRQNFFEMTWAELLKAVNEIRPESAKVRNGHLRHEVKRLGLKKMIQIRWCKADIKFLKENYKVKGNIEIAEILTEKGRSKRKIDGEMEVRSFSKKNVEKKMVLLGLNRTATDLKNIRARNKELGRGWTISKGDNLYTRGLIPVRAEGETCIWNTSDGNKRRFIKINGKYTPYSRWYYISFVGPVPPGHIVYHKDKDYLNDDPDNYRMCKRRSLNSTSAITEAIFLLSVREMNYEKILPTLNYDKQRKEIRQIHADLNRIRKISKDLKFKLQKRKNEIRNPNTSRNNSSYSNNKAFVQQFA